MDCTGLGFRFQAQSAPSTAFPEFPVQDDEQMNEAASTGSGLYEPVSRSGLTYSDRKALTWVVIFHIICHLRPFMEMLGIATAIFCTPSLCFHTGERFQVQFAASALELMTLGIQTAMGPPRAL